MSAGARGWCTRTSGKERARPPRGAPGVGRPFAFGRRVARGLQCHSGRHDACIMHVACQAKCLIAGLVWVLPLPEWHMQPPCQCHPVMAQPLQACQCGTCKTVPLQTACQPRWSDQCKTRAGRFSPFGTKFALGVYPPWEHISMVVPKPKDFKPLHRPPSCNSAHLQGHRSCNICCHPS